MAIIPGSNLSGLPRVTAEDMKNNDPARMNRILRLIATQIQGVQTGKASSTTITNNTIIENVAGGGGGGAGGGGSTPTATVVTIQGTHAERLTTYLPNEEAAGTYFYETDRTVTYLNFISISAIQVWQYVSGIMFGTAADRPGDLGLNDSGFLFNATDLELTYLWDGASWDIFNNVEPILQETHANRLTDFPSTAYALSTLFFETDRTCFYIVQDAIGTVNTSGTAVTWATGDHFINTGSGFTAAQWPAGTPIIINGTAYAVAVVASPTALTLATSAGVQTGVAYSVASGRWSFASGTYIAAYASLPADLGENDTNFTFDDNATYYRAWTWGGAAWTYSVGQPPYLAVQMTMVNTADPGWHAADGSSVTASKSDGTTGLVTLPAPAGSWLEGGTYTGTQIPPVKSTLLPYTPAGAVSTPTFTGNPSGSVVVQSGTGSNVAPSFTPSGSISTPTFTGTPVAPTVDVEGAPQTMMFPLYVKL